MSFYRKSYRTMTLNVPLQPLFIFAQYYNVQVVQTTVSSVAEVDPETAIDLYPADEITSTLAETSDEFMSRVKRDHRQVSILKTSFGLEILIKHAAEKNMRGTIRLRALDESEDQDYSLEGPWHYQLIPGERTADLEYDLTWRKYSRWYHRGTEEKDIFEKHPALVSFYNGWAEEYRMWALGGDSGGFPVLQHRVAWEVAGHLMACWLLLQDVQTVKYQLITVDGEQYLTLEGMEDALGELMELQIKVLRGRSPRTLRSVASFEAAHYTLYGYHDNDDDVVASSAESYETKSSKRVDDMFLSAYQSIYELS